MSTSVTYRNSHSIAAGVGAFLFSLAVCVSAGSLSGCGSTNVMTLPSPVSPAPTVQGEGLRAGFGRADITPPPGVPLTGNGLDARQSTGYRHRLYVRAMVLEDGNGERIALVVADLPEMSPVLHRLVAARTLRNETGIGADRLILSVTHTHAGPGNFFGAKQYNQQAGALPGYDPRMVDFLVDRIATSIEKAALDLGPAVAQWGTLNVTGLTMNRSLEAFERNRPTMLRPRPDRTLTPDELEWRRERAVDTVMTMLRVDRCDAAWSGCKPRGAYTVFAIHGTGYPAANPLLDGDIQAIAERGLEAHIENVNPSLGREFRSKAFHLFANGSVGDASAKHAAGTRCGALLRHESGRAPGGPWRPPAPERWRAQPEAERNCLELARRSVNDIGGRLAEKSIELYNSIGTDRLTRQLDISRAFSTLYLPSAKLSDPLCSEPRSGLAQAAGSTEDAATRMAGWRLFGFLPIGIEEGGRAVDRGAKGCHGAKRELLGRLQGLAVGEYGFPKYAQLTLVKIGNTILAAVPVEVTTTAGARAQRVIRRNGPAGVERVVLVSLANGYLSYLTTEEEYSAQHYEGGSTLYGPNSAAAINEQLSRLAAHLATGNPLVEVEPIIVDPGPYQSYFPKPDRGPVPLERSFVSITCGVDGLAARWLDAPPGPFLPADGPVLIIERQLTPMSGTPVARDDEGSVEVRAIGMAKTGYLWEVRWVPVMLPPGSYRVSLLRGNRANVVVQPLDGEWVACPGS